MISEGTTQIISRPDTHRTKSVIYVILPQYHLFNRYHWCLAHDMYVIAPILHVLQSSSPNFMMLKIPWKSKTGFGARLNFITTKDGLIDRHILVHAVCTFISHRSVMCWVSERGVMRGGGWGRGCLGFGAVAPRREIGTEVNTVCLLFNIPNRVDRQAV